MDYSITTIQFFPSTHIEQVAEDEFKEIKTYSANIAINDDFIIQLSGDENTCKWSIPTSNEQGWKDAEKQDEAYEKVDKEDLVKFLESEGVENNYYWLESNADETYK